MKKSIILSLLLACFSLGASAQFSGEVGVCQSLDNGETFSEEVPLSDWLNTDPDELYNSLNETRILILHFVLHDNATLSRFKITYIN